MGRCGATLAGLLVALTAAGPAAGAARTWHPALVITPRGAQPGAPSAAAGTGGEGLTAFTTTIRGRSRVEARVRGDARAPWAQEVLSGTFPTAPEPPAAALEVNGRAVVAWRVPGGAVRSAVRDRPGGAWRVIAVAPGGPVDAASGFRGARATMDGGDGSAALVWAERTGGAWTVRSARRGGPGAAWSETPPLALGPGAAEPALALAVDGTAAVAWTVPSSAAPFATGPVHAAVRSTEGAWTSVTTLAAAGGLFPSATAGADGRAAVAWQDGATSPTVVVAEAGIGSAWGAPQPVTAGQAPRIGENADGTLALTWASAFVTPEATPILASVKPAGASAWPAGVQLTDGRDMSWVEASEARVAVGGTGRALVAFLDPEGPGSATVRLAAARAGEPWVTQDVPVGIDAPRVGLSAAAGGNGLAALPSESSDGGFVQAADFDGYLRPVVRAALAGRLRGDGTVGWTATVRNAGRVPARGVRLHLFIAGGIRFISSEPRAARGARSAEWTLPRLAPGAVRTIRLRVRHPGGRAGTLSGYVAATATRPQGVSAVARP